jgi:uncharacterized protein (TIGR02597 family)
MNKQNVTVLSVVLAALGWASAAQAQSTVEVTTTPVGMVNVPCPGNAETIVSLSFHRDAAFTGEIASVAGSVITVSGSPGWTNQQFVYASPSQRETYYVLIGGGVREGKYYAITANTANTLTVSAGGDDLSVLTADTPFEIVPFWTLGKAFPNGEGVHVSTSHILRKSLLLMFRQATLNSVGVNQIPEDIFYFYGGSGTRGWRKAGAGINTLQDDVPLEPNVYFVIRHNELTATSFFNIGTVGTHSPALLPLVRTQVGQNQDNFIGIPTSVPMTLAQSDLVQSGAFLGSANHVQREDLLLVFDETLEVKNKIPTKIYYYYTGSAGAGPGWRLAGAGINNKFDDDLVFKPGSGYVIRKKGQVSSGVLFWPVEPPYLSEN